MRCSTRKCTIFTDPDNSNLPSTSGTNSSSPTYTVYVEHYEVFYPGDTLKAFLEGAFEAVYKSV